MSGKCSSIRLGETVFPLWAASKDMYTSSSAKYSKFKLSHADFAEHLLRFHIQNSCSLCCGDTYSSKCRSVGVQTEKEKPDSNQHHQQTEKICERKPAPAEKAVKIHLDHAYFTMFPKRLKNNKRTLRRRRLSLSQFQDFPANENDGRKENSEDDDDDETLTASEKGSEDETSVFPVSLSTLGCIEGDTDAHSVRDDGQKRLESRVQKQRESVEGIISKIKRKKMGAGAGAGEGVIAVETSQRQGMEFVEGINSKTRLGVMGEGDEENFITALYSMAAGNDVRPLAEMMDRQQRYSAPAGISTARTAQPVKEMERSRGRNSTTGRTTVARDEPKVCVKRQDYFSTMELICEDNAFIEVEEGKEENEQPKKKTPDVSQEPKIDTKQVKQAERLLQKQARKRMMEVNKGKKKKKSIKPIKIPQKKIYRPHPRLDVQLARLPKMYECKMCFSHFHNPDEMSAHYAEAHPREISDRTLSWVQTVGASSNFFPMLALKQIATELRQCKECKEYVDNIKVHRRSHWVKKFVCDVCGKGFVFKSILQKHQVYHNAQWRLLKSHKCGMCSNAYIDKTSLNAHVLSAHNQGEKCFICEQCGKRFARKKSLTVHRDTHLKEKPFRCFECGRGFTQKNNMKLHMRTHTGVKPYRCDECNKDFRHKVSLKMHQKKVHGIDWWKERGIKQKSRFGTVIPSQELTSCTPAFQPESVCGHAAHHEPKHMQVSEQEPMCTQSSQQEPSSTLVLHQEPSYTPTSTSHQIPTPTMVLLQEPTYTPASHHEPISHHLVTLTQASHQEPAYKPTSPQQPSQTPTVHQEPTNTPALTP